MGWLATLAGVVEREGAAARAVIIATEGPTPRSVGSDMIVSRAHVDGKIGRGEAQQSAVSLARELIGRLQSAPHGEATWLRTTQRFATGEVLGQRSGGSITVLVEAFGPAEIATLAAETRHPNHGREALLVARPLATGRPARLLSRGLTDLPDAWAGRATELFDAPHLRLLRLEQPGTSEIVIESVREARPAFHVYGTGLVARALVEVLAALPFRVIWIDTAPGHFPDRIPAGVEIEIAEDVVVRAGRCEPGAFHAVMTSAHDVDLDVCRALLSRGGFVYLGVIGSRLKRKRMLEAFRSEGIGEDEFARVSCPIGLQGLRSKTPSVIAVGIAAEALLALNKQAEAAAGLV